MSNSKKIATETLASTEATTSTTKMKDTPVNERFYKLVNGPVNAKGAQRRIVIDILATHENPMTALEVSKLAEAQGLKAVGGVLPSCRYHLHHLVLLGIAEVVNPKIEVEISKAA